MASSKSAFPPPPPLDVTPEHAPPARTPRRRKRFGCGTVFSIVMLAMLGLTVGGLVGGYRYLMTELLDTEPLALTGPSLFTAEVRSLDHKIEVVTRAISRGGGRTVRVAFSGPELTHLLKRYSVQVEGIGAGDIESLIEIQDDYMTAAFTVPLQIEGEGKRFVNLMLVGTPKVVDGHATLTLYSARLGDTKTPRPFLPRLASIILQQVETHPNLQGLPVEIYNLTVEQGQVNVEFVTKG